MIKNFYNLNVTVCSLLLYLLATVSVSASVNAPEYLNNALFQTQPNAPSVSNDGQFETSVALWVTGSTGQTTELYRSLQSASGYQLIATFPSEQGRYWDDNLKPRTTYYYKARVLQNGVYSNYSSVLAVTTLSNYYPPILTARAISPTSIQLTLTDRSYVDIQYDIEGSHNYMTYAQLSDSGRTVTFINDGLLPNTQYDYRVTAYLEGEGMPIEYNTATASARTESSETTLEEIVLYDWEVRENNVSIWWTNVNPGSQTELYRLNPFTGSYDLIAVQDAEDDGYFDQNLSPRTQYTYKLRAVNGDQSSNYTTLTVQTLSKNYPPTLTAKALDPFTVELSLKDNSYNDISYHVYLKGNPNAFSQTVELPDSGKTVILKHTPTQPNTTYTYVVESYVKLAPREGETLEEVVETSVTTPPAAAACDGTGSIEREFWWNFTSTDLSTIPVTRTPDKIVNLTQFETANYQGNNYASRIRGFLCPEVSGTYLFHIASDDQSILYLSTDANPANKRDIASVTGSTMKGEFQKYPLQVSEEIELVRGQRYYIEVRHRDAGGGDFVQVAWTLPASGMQVPIPGKNLIPFNYTPQPQACANTGKLQWQVWRNFTGTLDNVPTNTTPDYITDITKFETPQYFGNSYASRAYGFICPPQTGDYVFYLASDDKARLFLSTDASPATKRKIAEVTGSTGYDQWTKYPTQTSATIRLQQGQKYYIEVLHQEVSGNDFIRVGWKLPNGTIQRPIPGANLMPYAPGNNNAPAVAITSPTDASTFSAPASINIQATATDSDGTIAKVEFFNGTTKLGEDTAAPYQYTWNNVSAGTYQIRVAATDNGGAVGQAMVTVNVSNACAATGRAYREIWFNVPGSQVGNVPVNTSPNYWDYLTQLETPQYYGNDYATRIRGYLCVPMTGDYTFMISSDDESELRISMTEDPAQRFVIALVPGASPFRTFTKYPDQKSAKIRLVQGNRYFFEILHKESNGNDHVTVGWQLPNGTIEAPIGSNRIIPWGDPSVQAASFADAQVVSIGASENALTVFPNPTKTRNVTLSLPGANPSGEAKVQVVSMNGAIIFDEVVKCNGDCGNLPIALDEAAGAGIYMINVFDGRKRTSTKLVVE